MAPAMMLTVAHLWLVGITLVGFASSVPGVIRRLSSDAATGEDWGKVLRRRIVPLTVIPAVLSVFAFLVIYQVTTGHTHIDLLMVTDFLMSYTMVGVAALLGLWAAVFMNLWYQRGSPAPEFAR